MNYQVLLFYIIYWFIFLIFMVWEFGCYHFLFRIFKILLGIDKFYELKIVGFHCAYNTYDFNSIDFTHPCYYKDTLNSKKVFSITVEKLSSKVYAHRERNKFIVINNKLKMDKEWHKHLLDGSKILEVDDDNIIEKKRLKYHFWTRKFVPLTH